MAIRAGKKRQPSRWSAQRTRHTAQVGEEVSTAQRSYRIAQ
ncbi:MAG: hypothetical protein WA635_11385 [Gallionella sp.]